MYDMAYKKEPLNSIPIFVEKKNQIPYIENAWYQSMTLTKKTAQHFENEQ